MRGQSVSATTNQQSGMQQNLTMSSCHDDCKAFGHRV